MFWIGLIVVRIDFQKYHVFRPCDIDTSWNMGQIKVRVGHGLDLGEFHDEKG